MLNSILSAARPLKAICSVAATAWVALLVTFVISSSAYSVYFSKKRSIENSRELERLWSAVARHEQRIAEMERKRSVKATVTGYSSERRQTDSTPFTTAFMKDVRKVKPGLIAVSWDLLEEGWTSGRCVWIEGTGVRKIDDSMSRRWRNEYRVDIWFHSRLDAEKFGVKRNVLVTLMEECGEYM